MPVSNLVIGINLFGSIVSLFSIYVTYSLYQKYKLETSIFFIVTSIAVFIWNSLHLALNYLGPSQENYELARLLWIIVVISGIVFIFSFIFGYSMLRYENINWRLLVYSAAATAFSILFIVKDDWVNVTYVDGEGWVTHVINNQFWSIFAISIFIADFIEIIIPLVNTYAKTTKNKNALLIMLLGILLAIFSNALEPLLSQLDAPQAIRFLIADFGFLIFFVILLKYPFTGLYDHSRLDQIIVAGTDGVPKLLLTDDTNKAILASGALISINSILEEMTASTKITDDNKENRRKIELGVHQFYIIIRQSIVVVFQFQNPSGVCFTKFKSLGRILDLEEEQRDESEMLDEFHMRVQEYFTEFNPLSLDEDKIKKLI